MEYVECNVGSSDLFEPRLWGLSVEAVDGLGARLQETWERFRACFRTATRDSSRYAYHYVSGLLRMKEGRNFANIGRQTGQPEQNIQHFMSNSPWSAWPVLQRIQAEIAAKPELAQGGVLLVDETADEKAGVKSAGASRQYNGRMGKVDLSQVGVFLAYANISPALPAPVWTWVDGELFLREEWFSTKMTGERKRLGMPSDRRFATKIALGWQMIERAKGNGLPFEAVACDNLYGRARWFRDRLDAAGILYMAEVLAETQVYLTEPVVGIPPEEVGHRGRHRSRERVLSPERPITTKAVAQRADTDWRQIRVRSTERGELNDWFAARRVWVHDSASGLPGREEWLVIRREANGDLSYALSNASADTPLERLAWLKCQRYFVERANQDAKSEAGWDEFQAQKYLAWQHHLALTALAMWFIAETKLDWAKGVKRDPKLAQQFDVDVLPMLSTGNVREMLRATMPLPQLSREQATQLVVKHLVNRTRARKSRIKRGHHSGSSP